MGANDANPQPALGFLTVLDHPQHGLFGGYLLLNTAGRPVEFHCTAPIKPNRAQEILYGPTLESFLYGEQIGQTLVQKASVEPFFVCTDRRPVLAVRAHVSLPVVLILPAEDPSAEDPSAGRDGKVRRIDAAHFRGADFDRSGSSTTGLVTFQLGQNRLAVSERSEADRQLILQRLAGVSDWFADSFDLAEPFVRIRQAIEEAQQAAR